MADFRPETTVYLFKATGVDDRNQPYFESEGAKMAWYNSHVIKAFSDYSYQREQRQYIRVQEKAEFLREFDMMAFQNGAGERWILCRITGVEFINPNCTEITFETDYMQTYMDVIIWGQCWVEREMQENDWNGSEPSFNNLMPEGIESGKLTRTEISEAVAEATYDSFDLIVVSLYDQMGDPIYNIKTTNFYPSGLNSLRFGLDRFGSVPGLQNLLERYETRGIDVSKAIVGMFIVPSDYSGGTSVGVKDIPITPPYPIIDGYTVVNAKCFTSEFFRLELSNRRGESVELKPENFTETSNILLQLKHGSSGGQGGSMLYARGYEGHSMDFGVVRVDDVQAAFVGNAFASNFGSNLINLGTNALSSAVVAGAMFGNPVGAAGGALAGAIASMGKMLDQALDPSALGGQASGSMLEVMLDNYGFSINWVHPYVANLKSIDEYFGRFGYRTNRYKVPNVNTRPKWNFIKTSGAICRGSFSKTAQDYMQRICDNGVTLWHLSPGEEISGEWNIDQNKE